ncbi:hypothetical protein QW060_10740 [Myroides ceti]|uniref:NADH dehydrogenase subunit 1 n=1 Tax=Paenimyroides ceti TaxID=395087 RepID=A0ABT8CTP0_9FLAO|nr:hypothetical protein [Paenimyroides ceti]MDN3707610.1 hypothetical protein [Paenimyroides ceti]
MSWLYYEYSGFLAYKFFFFLFVWPLTYPVQESKMVKVNVLFIGIGVKQFN